MIVSKKLQIIEYKVFLYSLLFLIPFFGMSQVNITNAVPSVLINFSNTMPTSVGTNPSTAYAGNGFSPNPTIAGRLNSNAWDVQGFTFGTLGFGGTQTLDSFGRGSVTSGVITTGIYAFTELPATVANPTLMIQPGAGEFAPGSITLRIRNNGTSNMTQLQVSYNLFFRNDGDMSNSFNFSHSDDNIIYVEEPTMDFISPELLDPFEWVQESVSPSRSFVISGINVAPGGFYYIRWSCDDVSGTGIRDEFGLDDIQITGTYGAPAPEINVTGAGIKISNGDLLPRVADGTEFAPIGAPLSTFINTILKTFNIQNIGGLPLTISSVVIGGPNPEDFTIFIPTAGSPPTGTISEIISGAISSNELNIVFDPSVAGLRRATVYIYSDDADENPYVFNIRGYGFNPTPEITLTGNTGGTGPIASGSLTPLVGNNTLYTTQIVGVTNQTKDFKIKNDGTTVLTLTGVSPYITIGGTNPSDFSLVTFPSTPNMNLGFFKTFSINFNPTAPGIRTAIVSIANNDSNENPYTFLIQGTGISPEMDVTGNGQPVVSGSTVPTFVNDTFFDYININATTNDRIFTVQNNGTSPLNIGAITISGPAATEYSILTTPAATLAIGASTTFTIRFDPSSVGLKDAVVSIVNNDLNENPYTFAINGYGVNYTTCDFGAIETIAIQDFESTPALPTWGYTTTGVTTLTNGTAYAVAGDGGLTNKFIGARSLQASNSATARINMNAINTSLFSDVQLNVKIGAFAGNTAGGMDGIAPLDRVIASISTNGGLSWSDEVQVVGNNNSAWSFDSGIASATKVFTGTNLVQTFSPSNAPLAAINYQTTEGYSNLVITGLPKISNLLIRLSIISNSGQEVWAIDNVTLYGRRELTSTWNGTTWSDGTPTSSVKAIIGENYETITDGNLTACKCQIATGKIVTIGTNSSAVIESNIDNGGSIIIENSGSLVQRNDFAINSGNNINVKRTTTDMIEYDYTYWSSPVGGQTLYNLSPQTSADRFYAFSPTLGNWVPTVRTSVMSRGKGYIVRAPDSYGNTPTAYNAEFIGSINNGFIQTPIINSVSEWNLIGNPYPSAIDADAFLDLAANTTVIGGTIYLWTHNTPISASSNYTANDYAVYNKFGGVGTRAALNPGINNTYPLGKIASGQGFFVRALANGDATFINSMRIATDNATFYRTNQNQNTVESHQGLEKHRLWLNLTNTQGAFKQTLVGYVQNGTNDIDRDFDGTTISAGNIINFYSICNNQNLSIQGRMLPFSEEDVILLGYSSNLAGTFTITLENYDGLFENYESIFLEDKLLNSIHNIKSSPYTFTTSTGIHNNRFSIRYNNQSLGNSDFDNANQVIITTNDLVVDVYSNKESIEQIEVFDMLGRKILFKKDINALNYKIENMTTNQTLIVKIKLQNGIYVTKKVIVN
jgi:hypothetical protein